MRLRLLPRTGALLAAVASADLVTLKNGTRIEGTVVSMNADTGFVKSEAATQTINRAAARAIEFGHVLVTGVHEGTCTNND